nr:hypothetical protein [Tanacetum cinerariifolium]
FEFDEDVADDGLMTKKTIIFRLCGKAYAMSILDFAKRLGFYTGAEIQEYTFETYFIGGRRNDDDFSANQTLDANILKELIGSNGRLIVEEITHSIPIVATPRAPCPATSDLYDKISLLETQIGEVERMTCRQSYHSEKYARVLEHVALIDLQYVTNIIHQTTLSSNNSRMIRSNTKITTLWFGDHLWSWV